MILLQFLSTALQPVIWIPHSSVTERYVLHRPVLYSLSCWKKGGREGGREGGRGGREGREGGRDISREERREGMSNGSSEGVRE